MIRKFFKTKLFIISIFIWTIFIKNTIAAPLTFTGGTAMSFGQITSDNIATYAILNKDTGNMSGTAIIIPSSGAIYATFNLSGDKKANIEFGVSLTPTTQLNGPGNPIAISNYTHISTGQLSNGQGNLAVQVGARIDLSAFQASGTYSNTFKMRARYSGGSWVESSPRNVSVIILPAPIQITELPAAMNFGTFAPDLTGGVIRLSPTANSISIVSGFNTEIVGGANRGGFTISGNPGSSVNSISLGPTATLTNGGGGVINLSNFTMSPATPITLSGMGTATFRVGVDAAFGSNLPNGAYNGTYNVNVDY